MPVVAAEAYAPGAVPSHLEQGMTDPSSAPAADVRMDLVGQACATLTPMIAFRMRELVTGQVLEVVSDDPTARSGLAAWSRLTGNPIVAIVDDEAGQSRYYLRRK